MTGIMVRGADPVKDLPTVVGTTGLVRLDAARADGSCPDVAGGNFIRGVRSARSRRTQLVNFKYSVFVKAEN